MTYANIDNLLSTQDLLEGCYQQVIEELKTTKTKIVANWEGDTADIADICNRIDALCDAYYAKLNPAIQEFALASYNLGMALKENANATVQGGAASGQTNASGVAAGTGSTTGTTTTGDEEPGFWAYHGQNYAEAWTEKEWFNAYDFSEADGFFSGAGVVLDGTLSVAGDLLGALVDTCGATISVVLDGAANLVGWMFD